MATTNLPLSATDGWTLVVPSAATWALVSSIGVDTHVEFATTASDSTEPTVNGHVLDRSMQISRATLITGSIWARVPAAERYGSASTVLVVDYG